MNDTELDRLLNTWEAPVPPPSLCEGLRGRVSASRTAKIRPPVAQTLRDSIRIGITVLKIFRYT